MYYDLVSLYEVNNRMTKTEEMQQSGEKIMKIVAGERRKKIIFLYKYEQRPYSELYSK